MKWNEYVLCVFNATADLLVCRSEPPEKTHSTQTPHRWPLTAEAESRLSFNVCVEEFSFSTHKSEVQTIWKEQ